MDILAFASMLVVVSVIWVYDKRPANGAGTFQRRDCFLVFFILF